VVGHDRVHKGDGVLGIEPAGVDRVDELDVEDPAVAGARLGPELEHCRADPALVVEDLGEEALEEDRMPGLVGDLGREEDPLVLQRGGVEHRRQGVGDDLLADEEEDHRRPERLLDGRRDVRPLGLVGAEVEIRDRPLLSFPTVVEGGAVELRVEQRVHLGRHVLDGDVDELAKRGLLDAADGLEGGGVCHQDQGSRKIHSR